MNICLFGNFTVEAAVRFQSDKIRALFAYIAVHAGSPIPRSQLAPLLWGGFPDKAAYNNARISLSRLKKALAPVISKYGDGLFEITRKTVQINPVDGVQIDFHSFEQLWARCEQTERALWADRGQVIHALTELVKLYHGPFLDGFILDDAMEFDEWVTVQRERAHQRMLIALETLAEHHIAHGNWGEAQRHAEHQLRLEPWHELAHRQLIEIHHRAGRRDAALAQFERCQEVLGEELGVEPSKPTVALFEAIRQERMPAVSAPAQTPAAAVRPTPPPLLTHTAHHNLPSQLTPLIGRESELAQLQQLLAGRSYRLLTVLGHGGIGKTRLSLALAESQLRFFAHGVFFVPLAAAIKASGMLEAIADALNVSLAGKREPLAQVRDYLRERELLLVLDNLEQLVDEEATADAMLALLEAAPNLIIVVTSRQRLWLRSETTIALSGLAYPAEVTDEVLHASWQQFDALRLFVERMQRANLGYEPNADLPYILQICQLVDGLPLALELAATQSSMESCATIARSLAACMGTLQTQMRDVPKRQRSLEAVFDYSWCLLNSAEQAILARLSIFRGGFARHAVEQIVPNITKPLLQKLVDHSLLRQQPSGRYDQHEMVRQFAATRLDPDAQTQLEQHYVDSYLSDLTAHAAALEGREPHRAAAKLLPEFNNLQHAWQLALDHQKFAQLRAASQALSNLLQLRSLYHLGHDLFMQAVDATTAAHSEAAHQAKAEVLAEAARFQLRLANHDTVITLTKQAIALAQESESFWVLGNAVNIQSEAYWRTGNYQAAIQTLDAHQTATEKYARLLGSARFNLGRTYLFMRQFDTATHHLQKSLSIWQKIEHKRFEANTLNTLGITYLDQKLFEQAISFFKEGLAVHQRLGNQHGVAIGYINLAAGAIGQEQFERAKTYCTQAYEYLQNSGALNDISLTFNNLGWAHYQLNEDQEADEVLQRALGYAVASGNQFRELQAMSNLADVKRRLREVEQATKLYKDSLEGWTKIGRLDFANMVQEKLTSLQTHGL